MAELPIELEILYITYLENWNLYPGSIFMNKPMDRKEFVEYKEKEFEFNCMTQKEKDQYKISSRRMLEYEYFLMSHRWALIRYKPINILTNRWVRNTNGWLRL